MMKVSKVLASALLLAVLGAATAAQAPAQEQPMAGEAQEQVAWLRIVNTAPAAENVSVELRSNDGEPGAIGETFADMGYLEVGEYVEIPAGTYDVHVAHNDDFVYEDSVTLSDRAYYTLLVTGLYVPEAELLEEEDDGFFAWLRDLFTGDDPADRDELALRADLSEDELEVDLEPGQTRIRAVHAAPGTAPIDIAVEGERGSIIGNLDYGEWSRYHEIDEAAGNLVVRMSGSLVKVLDLAEFGIEEGMVNTIVVAGTPVEEMSIEAVILADAPVAPADPLADPVGAPAEPVEEAPAEEPVEDDAVAEEDVEEVVQVVLDEWTIDMAGTVSAGMVTFEIVNEGGMPHSFAIEGEGVQEGLTMEIEPGESMSMTIELQPGTYRAYCPIGDHAEEGMETEFQVEQAGG